MRRQKSTDFQIRTLPRVEHWRDKLPFATSQQTLRVRLAKVSVQAQATAPGSAVLIQRRRLPVALAALMVMSPAFRPKLAGWLSPHVAISGSFLIGFLRLIGTLVRGPSAGPKGEKRPADVIGVAMCGRECER